MMKIIIDDKIPFIRGAFEPFADVAYIPGKKISPEDVRDADALLTRTRTFCDRELLGESAVKVIATATIGYDHIDTAWCESRGIVWRNAPGCNSGSVAQYVASALLSLARKHGLRLQGMTLGVVGVGNVGSKVAAAARALGMKVLLNDPPRSRREGPEAFVSLETLVASSDIITLHVPLNEDGPDATRHLFDEQLLARMSPGQILINSSRGPVVDNAALKQALAEKRLRAAVLDVWEGEPGIDLELMGLLDYATPHIAGYSADGKANGTMMSVRTVAEVLGLPLSGWMPYELPEPDGGLSFEIDARGRGMQEVLTEAVLHTYDIQADTDALRSDPALFEKLRGDYPVRREAPAFSVRIIGGTPEYKDALRMLGFNVTD